MISRYKAESTRPITDVFDGQRPNSDTTHGILICHRGGHWGHKLTVHSQLAGDRTNGVQTQKLAIGFEKGHRNWASEED
jgi:hypothetical protein